MQPIIAAIQPSSARSFQVSCSRSRLRLQLLDVCALEGGAAVHLEAFLARPEADVQRALVSVEPGILHREQPRVLVGVVDVVVPPACAHSQRKDEAKVERSDGA